MQSDGKIPLNVAMEIVNVVEEFHYTKPLDEYQVVNAGPKLLVQQKRDIAQSIVLFLSGRAKNIYPAEPGLFHPGLVQGGEARVSELTNPKQVAIPDLIVTQLDNYAAEHLPPGDFVTAVLKNDLREVVYHADENSWPVLREIWWYCHRSLPIESWGNESLVDAWLSFEGKGVDEDARDR